MNLDERRGDSMILTHVCGTLADAPYAGKKVDPLQLDYADAQKRLLRRTTREGRDIALRLSPEAQLRGLQDGDVLLEEGDTVVAVEILPVMALVAKPEGARLPVSATRLATAMHRSMNWMVRHLVACPWLSSMMRPWRISSGNCRCPMRSRRSNSRSAVA